MVIKLVSLPFFLYFCIMKNKINRNLLYKIKGFKVIEKYSETMETDKRGRWARSIYFNGFCIANIQGFVKQEEMPILEIGRIGTVNSFCVSLNFPTTSSPHNSTITFDDYDESVAYCSSMFIDFIKLVNIK